MIHREAFICRSHLKKMILVQDKGGAELQPAGILKYVEDLKRGPNAEIGPKDFFETASNEFPGPVSGGQPFKVSTISNWSIHRRLINEKKACIYLLEY
jgi:hypothetical protein